ncbi:hypothetical protein GZH46_01856, partial [Fragariocoptes setiger]
EAMSQMRGKQVQYITLTCLVLIGLSVVLSDAAPFEIARSHPRQLKDRGCYYMLKHYQNGEQIHTDEPCLNCTCQNSMLMCYLRVCPYIRPLGDRCIIERVQGECCPRITCPDVVGDAGEDWTESPTTSSPSTTTTQEPLNDVLGCYIDGKHYKEGTQLPHAGQKPCETCYCIRNSSACVMQNCALEVSGCDPIYQSGECCPTRYNCSSQNAFNTPRPGIEGQQAIADRFLASQGNLVTPAKNVPLLEGTLSTTPASTTQFNPPKPGCKVQSSGRVFMDGESVPSKNPCEHCYCMRNEI